jgi:predicted nucleotidyltransferase
MMPSNEHGYMSDRDAATAASRTDAHAEAAQAFVERARSRFGEQIEELYVFGSTVRGEARGLASDVDVLVVLDDDDREARPIR